MEERRWRTDDQPMGLLNEALQASAFVAHPYHHPVVGWMDDLQHMTIQDIQGWYQRWYAPNNATLVVAGDVDAKRVQALAERYFGGIPRKTLPVTKPQNEPVQQGLRRVVVKAPAENPYVVMAFKVPTLRDVEKDDDVYALDVLSAVLDGYDNARLTAKLIRSDKVANEVGAPTTIWRAARSCSPSKAVRPPVPPPNNWKACCVPRSVASHKRAWLNRNCNESNPVDCFANLQARFDFWSGDGNRHHGNVRHFPGAYRPHHREIEDGDVAAVAGSRPKILR